MSYEMSGTLIALDPVREVSATFKVREFVIEVPNERNADWNQFVKLQTTQDRCSMLDTMQLGDKLNVTFDVKGRKWEKDGRVSYFNSLEAWRIEKADASYAADAPAPPFTEAEIPPAGENDDLPF